MLQDDSNGEQGFEIVDKKLDELSTLGDKTESMSSMSSSASLIASPGGVSGNLLSSVAPPAELPSFLASPSPLSLSTSASLVSPLQPAPAQPQEPFYPTAFSPAIPPSKGVTSSVPCMPVSSTNNEPGEVTAAAAGGVGAVASAEPAGGLLGWMKDAVASGGLLSRVAERAKHSVDSMITTLDPQMREFIYSGGDLDILVASDKEIKISPVREAFQSVFGKATVTGIQVQSSSIAAQPVGFAAGMRAAEERLAAAYAKPHVRPVPVVAVENFLLQVEDKWYDMGVLMLTDPERQICLQTLTQAVPVPGAVVLLAQEDTPSDYPHRDTGFAITIGSLMASNLQVDHSQWHQALTGVSRREMILLAARTLAGLYKKALNQN